MISPVKLGSVHLSEDDLRELETCLASLSETSDMTINVKSNGFTTTEPTIERILSHNSIEGDSLAYEIELECDEGSLRIVADSESSEEHLLFVDGDEEWAYTAKSKIQGLMKEKKKRLRSAFSRPAFVFIEVFGAIVFSSVIGVFIPGPMLFPAIHWYHYPLLFFSTLGLFAAIQRNRVHPYFALSTDGSTSYPRLAPLSVPISFVVGMLIAKFVIG